MTNESKIYAKEQQIIIIDNILCNLCSVELTSGGRKYLNKMMESLKNELNYLKLEKTEDKNRRWCAYCGPIFRFAKLRNLIG